MTEFVVRVPASDPPADAVFLSGDAETFGRWRPNAVRLDRQPDGTYRTLLALPVGLPVRYLVTRGTWRTAEVDAAGKERPPRELHVFRPTAFDLNVAGWGRGAVRYHHRFRSAFLDHARTIAVHLPPGYDAFPERRYPVFYLHDGQNLFDADTAFGGVPWAADEVAERTARAGDARPVILVGVANSPDRIREYGPRRDGDDLAELYGRFLVEEVKPFVDRTYRTLTSPDATAVGGSSLGGLIALHLCQQYPTVFGLCAAMSPSVWWDNESFIRSVRADPGWLRTCRVWADAGSLEGGILPRAKKLAAVLAEYGPRGPGRTRFREFPGAGHNEAAWGARFDQVLAFLFPPDRPHG